MAEENSRARVESMAELLFWKKTYLATGLQQHQYHHSKNLDKDSFFNKYIKDTTSISPDHLHLLSLALLLLLLLLEVKNKSVNNVR